jgi:hypothetical protein
MNFVIGAIGANFTLGLISGVTSAANGVYTLSSTILHSTSNGAEEIKQIIRETDLEVKIKTTQLLLCELKISDKSPNTVKYCVHAIHDAIREIADELDQVYYRMQYNSNLWVGSTVRSFKFHNNKSRLHAKLKNLESRTQTLTSIMNLQPLMYKNNNLDKEMSVMNDSLMQTDEVDPSSTAMVRAELHKKLEFMKE